MQRQGWMSRCNVASRYLSAMVGLHIAVNPCNRQDLWNGPRLGLFSDKSACDYLASGKKKKAKLEFELSPSLWPHALSWIPRSVWAVPWCRRHFTLSSRVMPRIRLSLRWPQSVSVWMPASKWESKTVTADFSSCPLCRWAWGSWVSLTACAASHTAHRRTSLSYSASPREDVSALQYLIFHYSLSNIAVLWLLL